MAKILDADGLSSIFSIIKRDFDTKNSVNDKIKQATDPMQTMLNTISTK